MSEFDNITNIVKSLKPDIKELEHKVGHYTVGGTYQEFQMLLAKSCLKSNPARAAYHLTETHSPLFRYIGALNSGKAREDNETKVMPLDASYFDVECSNKDLSEKVQKLLDAVEEMPKEWTLVQITPDINTSFTKSTVKVQPLHITVFNCGQSEEKPFTVTVDVPRDSFNNPIDIPVIMDEVYKRFDVKLKRAFSEANQELENMVKTVQKDWLKEWRVLFLGKCVESEVDAAIRSKLKSMLKQYNLKNVNSRTFSLLERLVRGKKYLDLNGFAHAVKFLLKDEHDKNFVKEMYNIANEFAVQLENKHPVILIVKENIDYIPFEMIDVCVNNPITRMQCLPMLYALYKEHEFDIVDGWKVISKPLNGAYLLNPSQNLDLMEKRMKAFFEYWVPDWKCIVGRRPTVEECLDLMTNSSVYSYSGHNAGFQYVHETKLEKLRINSVVLLFGCKSVGFKTVCDDVEPFGSSQHFILACSPCVVGNLYQVSDSDTDILQSAFLSTWYPSNAKTAWNCLEKERWMKGNCSDISTLSVNPIAIPDKQDPYLPSALRKAKRLTKHYLTQAACVIKGLPVRL